MPVSALLGAGVVVFSATVLIVGWGLGVAAARSVLPGLIHMAPLTAVMLAALGSALVLLSFPRGKTAGTALAVVSAAAGAAVLSEYLFGWSTGIDNILFARATAATGVERPGLPAPNTALAAVLIAGGVLSLRSSGARALWTGNALVLAATLLALQALIGYAYGVEPLYRVALASPIALHTSLCLLLLAVATLAARPRRWPAVLFLDRGPAGMVVRILVPVALLGPFLIGLVELWGERRGLYGGEVGTSLIAIGMILVIAAAALGSAKALSVVEQRRQAAEGVARKRENALREAIRSAPHPMMLHGPDGTIIELSQSWLTATGYAREDIPDVPAWTRLAYGDRHGTADEFIREGFDGSAARDAGEWTVRTASGEERVWTFTDVALSVSSGEERLLLSTAVDVTVQRELDERLRRDERHHRVLAQGMTALLDPGSVQERVTRLANFLVEELADVCVVEPELGARPPYQRTAAWRRPELSTVAEELASESSQGVARLNAVATAPLQGPRARHGVMLLVRTGPGASFTPAEEELVREIGRRAGTVAENALLHQEAMAAVSARDEVLSVVAHDLRGPLHTIAIASALQADSEIPEGKKAPQSDIIRRAVQQATELIEDLLESGRTGAGLNHVDARPDEAVAIARQAVERRASVAAAAGVHVQLHAPVGSVEIFADRRRLLQALDNVIGNAIRFTPSGGTVTVVVEGAEDVARFTVEDTGPGIRACDLERVFDRYWRAGDGGGAGLGLAIARAVVQAHGGRIWAENGSLGRGARFAFEIPTVASATEAGIPAPEASREALPSST